MIPATKQKQSTNTCNGHESTYFSESQLRANQSTALIASHEAHHGGEHFRRQLVALAVAVVLVVRVHEALRPRHLVHHLGASEQKQREAPHAGACTNTQPTLTNKGARCRHWNASVSFQDSVHCIVYKIISQQIV